MIVSKLDTQNINVLNYNENSVFVDSSKEHYTFNASRDGKTPSVVPMSLSELQYIASNTEIIVTGWLTFDDDVKEEIFKELRIANWKDILSNQDIEDILKNPTLEGLQKIVDIDNQTYFDRVRITLFKLTNDGVDISNKVVRIVNQRYDELRKRQRRSSIVLTKKDSQSYATPDDVKALSDQNASLQAQIEEMKKMMAQMIAAQTVVSGQVSVGPVENLSDDSIKTVASTQIKKAGRPKKSV